VKGYSSTSLELILIMLISTTLYSLIAIVDVATAGPKAPRFRQNHSRGFSNSSGVTLEILTNTGVKNATAPDLYGWMFEDINHSGDGGIYGELLTNRAFDGSDVTWSNISGFIGDSIIYQENACEAFGECVPKARNCLAYKLQDQLLQDTSQWETLFCVWTTFIL
jgi:hypothetical protein